MDPLFLPSPSPPSSPLPFITLTFAQSLDGSIATSQREPILLSGEQSLLLTHQLRAAHDAIMVGIGTVRSDNPRLNARLPLDGRNDSKGSGELTTSQQQQPRPVILDSELRCLPQDRFLAVADRPQPFIFAAKMRGDESEEVKEDRRCRAEALEKQGARIFEVDWQEQLSSPKRKVLDLRQILRELKAAGVNSVMVEGGTGVIKSFLEEELVDRVIITIAPKFIFGLRAVEEGKGVLPLVDVVYRQFGTDIVVSGRLGKKEGGK